jgi:preprotein translocase subunit SecF
MNIDIIGKRYRFFLISFIVIIPGLFVLLYMIFTGTLPVAIDFTGGSLLEVKFVDQQTPEHAAVIPLLNRLNVEDAQLQSTGEGTLIIRSSALDESAQAIVVQSLGDEFDSEIDVLRYENVGPTISQEVRLAATLAVAVTALVIVLYITYAFRKVPNAFRYGICAILAMIHDIAVVISVTALGAWLFGWQIDALFLTALLTVIGFSVQDKIVVFDRIRENKSIYRKLKFEILVNHSIVQTLQRSINTQLMTVEFMLLSLALFGGVTLREFALILLIGLFSGTYSSIFIAAPSLVIWENREWRFWFNRRNQVAAQ